MTSRLIALLVLTFGVGWSGAEELAFENELVRLTVNPNGTPGQLLEKGTGKQWLVEKSAPIAWVKTGGKIHYVKQIERAGELLQLRFADTAITTTQRISARGNHFVVELVDCRGEGIEEICPIQLQANIKENAGSWLDVRWNDQFALAFVGLSQRVNTGGGRAIVYSEFGMKGEKVAVIGAPRDQFLKTLQQVEKDFSLPTATIGGQWAKQSPDVKRGYLFIDLTQSNVDEVIRYAKLGGFLYVMTYDGTWASSLGSYPINMKNFPDGEAGLKATVDKLHSAGLKAGMHMLTSFVGKNDPLVRPVPDKRLLKDFRTSLAVDIDEATKEIAASDSVAQWPQEGAFYGDGKQGMDLLIDDEIIQYRRISADGKTFLQCTRGAHGTKKAAHKAGALIHHLCERYGSYLVDLRTTLKDEVADRIAGLVNRCGFDMIYFDGGECNMANGPYWYWVSQQQLAIWERFKRDVFVQGSGGTVWTWHFFARGACDDFASIAPKQYLDFHKIGDSYRHYNQSFMPAELGWWGFLADAPHHPATSLDEVEFYGTRMISLDVPVSLETHVSVLKQNGRTDELLEVLGKYESVRLGGKVPAGLREKLKSGEWKMMGTPEKPAFAPVRYEEQRLAGGGEGRFANAFADQQLQFRLQVAASLAAPDDAKNVMLVESEQPALLPLPAKGQAMPGAAVASVDLTLEGDERFKGIAGKTSAKRPVNLLKHRALAVTLQINSPLPAGEKSVLNVQLESTGKTYRDYYIDLDFTGRKTIILTEPNTARMLPEFRPAHANYAFKAAMYNFDYGNIQRLNFRWMRLADNAEIQCAVVSVEAVNEIDSPLENSRLTVGSSTLEIPAKLNTGDYVEWLGQGPLRVFDRNGKSLGELPAPKAIPQVPSGPVTIQLHAANGQAKFTLITTGPPISE